MKTVEFMGTSLEDLRAFPTRARQRAGYQIHRVQYGDDPDDWKPMRNIGPGAREIRIRADGAYRVIYVATFGEAVYILHAFQKKGQKTAKSDLNLAKSRYRQLSRAETT